MVAMINLLGIEHRAHRGLDGRVARRRATPPHLHPGSPHGLPCGVGHGRSAAEDSNRQVSCLARNDGEAIRGRKLGGSSCGSGGDKRLDQAHSNRSLGCGLLATGCALHGIWQLPSSRTDEDYGLVPNAAKPAHIVSIQVWAQETGPCLGFKGANWAAVRSMVLMRILRSA
jgi:hypothetical protein